MWKKSNKVLSREKSQVGTEKIIVMLKLFETCLMPAMLAA